MAEPAQRLVAVWRVTDHCNLACPFCGFDRRLHWPRRHASLAQVFNTFAALREAFAPQPLEISWLGGEPTLWPHLMAATAHVRAHGACVSMTTSGWCLDQPTWRNWMVGNLAALTLSIDDLASQHDALRGSSGLHARLLAGMCDLRALRGLDVAPVLRVNIVLMRDNIQRFDALCLALADAGVDEICFNALGGNDRPEFYPRHHLLPAQVCAFGERFADRRVALARRGVRLLGSPNYLARLSATAHGKSIAIADCEPGQRHVFINLDAHISPCSFTSAMYALQPENLQSEVMGVHPARQFAALRAARPAAACADCHCTNVFGKFEVAA